MAKTKLSTRILNAVRALRGERLVVDIPLPKMEVTPLRLETFQAGLDIQLMVLDMQGPETTAERARRDLASLIGKGLMDAGAIEISKTVDLDRGTLTYGAKVRVARPEEENNG